MSAILSAWSLVSRETSYGILSTTTSPILGIALMHLPCINEAMDQIPLNEVHAHIMKTCVRAGTLCLSVGYSSLAGYACVRAIQQIYLRNFTKANINIAISICSLVSSLYWISCVDVKDLSSSYWSVHLVCGVSFVASAVHQIAKLWIMNLPVPDIENETGLLCFFFRCIVRIANLPIRDVTWGIGLAKHLRCY